MSRRALAAAAILAISSIAPAQTVRTKIAPTISGPDPFSIEQGSTFSASSSSPSKNGRSAMISATVVSDIQEALSVIRQNYISRPSTGKLAHYSIDSMLRSLDPHSNYYDRAEYADLKGEQRSEYYGTGSTIAEYERDGRLETFILSTFPGSSSEKAGLRFGDRIVAVYGSPVGDSSSGQIRDLMRGPKGTTVSLTLERAGQTFNVTLRRDRVPQRTVTDAFMLADGVGVIRMPEGFSFTSLSEFEAAYSRLRQEGMRSLVFDLRGNPGGILDQSVKIAEKFLPEGSIIVSQRGRTPLDNREWRSANRSPETIPVVVMVDGDTASAAEIIAGALQDNDRAIIVGEKTFGKGLVQSVLDLPSGGGLTLTTARYFTPSGRSLQRDYEHNGSYDYYNHAAGTAIATKPTLTRTKREVYGGDGVAPDVRVAPEKVTQERLSLLDPIFFFAREHSSGAKPDVDLFAAFRSFARTEWSLSEAVIQRNEGFIKLRLDHDMALASGGPVDASRVLLEGDAQITKAVDAMPQAVAFASSYYVSRSSSKK